MGSSIPSHIVLDCGRKLATLETKNELTSNVLNGSCMQVPALTSVDVTKTSKYKKSKTSPLQVAFDESVLPQQQEGH